MTEPRALSRGEVVSLVVERPVAGGDMLARHDGRVVFVSGAIPGERVRARVDRISKNAAWARVLEVQEGSADRRATTHDPACGGLTYAHMAYARQLHVKSEVIGDAFARIGRIALAAPVPVAASAEEGYRLRARLHVRDGRAGFFRENTHALCDASSTGQLHAMAAPAVAATIASLGPRVADLEAVVLAENTAASERVLHLEPRVGARLDDLARRVALEAGVTGLTTDVRGRVVALAGAATVTDVARDLFGGQSPVSELAAWTRHASSFFQGNRFLTGALVKAVLDAAEGDRVADLYAGVGLFSVALAARGAHVVAVEGDPVASGDLLSNAGPWRERLRVVRGTVEASISTFAHESFDALVVDPPRTGLSPEALAGILTIRPARLVYVSCDPPTLARDIAKCVAAGYAVGSVRAFDLFPNTHHVETIVGLS
jgi:23S rRNA (uracil1939-C5)-methyltransferase